MLPSYATYICYLHYPCYLCYPCYLATLPTYVTYITHVTCVTHVTYNTLLQVLPKPALYRHHTYYMYLSYPHCCMMYYSNARKKHPTMPLTILGYGCLRHNSLSELLTASADGENIQKWGGLRICLRPSDSKL